MLLRIHPLNKFLLIAAVIGAAACFILSNFLPPLVTLGLLALLLCALCSVRYPVFGLYALMAVYPFQGLMIYYGSIDLPYVDLIALPLFGALLLRTLFNFIAPGYFIKKNEYTLNQWPALVAILIFLIGAALSLFNAPDWLVSFKYLLRPLAFFYLVYVIVPVNLIRSNKALKIVYYILFGVGLAVAANALMSVLFSSGSWYSHRAQPFILFGKNFLGGNHNAVAEVLTVSLPMAVILYYQARKMRARGWIIIGIMFMLAVLLLTLSRSGWLALLVELFIFAGYELRHRINKTVLIAVALSIVFAGSIFYLTIWNKADWIASSDSNRLTMISIAVYNFAEHPLIGNGLNTYRDMIGSTFVYWIEFAEPLDSHGFVQKLLAETGLAGTISFIGLLVYLGYVFVNGIRHAKNPEEARTALIMFAMFGGIVVFQLFSTSYFQAKMWVPIGVGLAYLGGRSTKYQFNPKGVT